MAERGIVTTAGEPIMGAGSAYKAEFLPVGVQYTLVTSNATASALGAGAIGDYLDGITIVPSSVSNGAVSIKDGGGPALTLFAGGASSLADLKPFYIPIKARSTSGGWSITTTSGLTAVVGGSAY
jgi:hypothetical protein